VSAESGVLVVDKPAGPTSHDVVDAVRRALGTRRVGHTGTLDPFASGVLAVCIEKATRLARFVAAGEKVYRATVKLGYATTTDDNRGEALGAPRPVAVDRAAVEDATRAFVGDILQVPPVYSAKRTAGERHYDLARAGKPVPREACPVRIEAIEVGEMAGDEVTLEVRCSAGTYIRALARDLGQSLGVGGHLASLRRLRSGSFSLGDAVTLDDLRAGGVADRIVPMARVLPDLPWVQVGAEGLRHLRHGRDLRRVDVLAGFPEPPPPPRLRVLDEAGGLLALAVPRSFAKGPPGLPMEPVLHPDLVLID
jgi:tRNA pseudouridine55 synthase